MKHDDPSSPESLEQDPVWDLLRQSPRPTARASFSSDVVRAARLESSTAPWWKRFWVPLSVGGLTTAATAALAIFLIAQQPDGSNPTTVAGSVVTTPAETLEALDALVGTEALRVAADDPAAFSDTELVSMIGF